MKLFFDTEFTGLHKDTTLISIGILDECDNEFYAEFNDYDENQVDEWIAKNVINKLMMDKYHKNVILQSEHSTRCFGSRIFIKEKLLDWLKSYKDIEFVSDVCYYDYVLLVDLLFGNALNVPDNITPCCHDINQDIENYYNITARDAFNYSREEIIEQNNILIKAEKHNSLYDAMVIKNIYSLIN